MIDKIEQNTDREFLQKAWLDSKLAFGRSYISACLVFIAILFFVYYTIPTPTYLHSVLKVSFLGFILAVIIELVVWHKSHRVSELLIKGDQQGGEALDRALVILMNVGYGIFGLSVICFIVLVVLN